MNRDDKVTYFAETDFRNKKTKFGIKNKDRSRHMYVIGMTGMGKSTMLENLAIQDIQSGEGVVFIDPHGGTAEKLLSYIPEHRIDDVVYFAPFDADHPISFNVLDDVDPKRRHLVVGGLMSAFKKIWVDAWSARMEYILQNILHALLEYPGATLLGVNRMLSDKDFRKKVVDNVTDPSVKAFWVEEYAKYTEKFAAEAAPAIQNKVGQFTGNPLIRNLVGQPKSSFDIRDLMDNRKILIVNLSKGRMGEDNSNLIGSMLITKMYLAAMSRADISEVEMEYIPNFNFYVDEFQSFASDSFANILSEARKYKLNLTIAHQYVEQMSDEVKAAVFGNVGTMVVFRVGSTDAEVFEKEFTPFFMLEDIVSLGQRQIYLRLMIDGVGSQPFSATTLPPIPVPEESYKQQVIDSSRMKFARKKEDVEKAIRDWHAPVTFSQEDRERDRQKGEQAKSSKGIQPSSNNQGYTSQPYFPKKSAPQGTSFGVQSVQPKPQPLSTRQDNVDNTRSSNPKVLTNNNLSLKNALDKELQNTQNTSQGQDNGRVYVENKSQPSKNRVSLSSILSTKNQPQNQATQAKERSELRTHISRFSNQVTQDQSKSRVEKSSQPEVDLAPRVAEVPVQKNTEVPADILKKLLE